MSAAWTAPLAVPLAFLCGALPFGLWIGRVFRGVDVRRMGSGNLGATNVYRSLGPALGVVTLVLDVLKGAVPVWVLPGQAWAAGFPGGAEWCRIAVAFAAVAGHVWTPFAGFRGGKGVATTVGVLLALAPLAFGVFVAVFVVVVAASRYISLGSIAGAIAFVVALALRPAGGAPTLAVGIALAALIVLRHRANLRRLVRGEEPRFSLRAGRGAS